MRTFKHSACVIGWLLGAISGCKGRSAADTSDQVQAAVARGRAASLRNGCDACHAIGGRRARIETAASLDDIAQQAFIAGVLPNTQGNLARWIYNPRAIKPVTNMPALALSEAEARDIAAYLYFTTRK